MSTEQISEIMRRLIDHCRWCQRVAVLTDTDGELLCPGCRSVIFYHQILSALPNDK